MTCVTIITGPTASGKSEFALHYDSNAIIINSDSVQIYKDLPILTASPYSNPSHKLYNISDYNQQTNVHSWVKDAEREINNALANHKRPILVGGTGMYISKFINGISEIPAIDPEITERLETMHINNGINALFQKLQELDYEYSKKIDNRNPARVIRALSVVIQTGKSIEYFHKKTLASPKYHFNKILLKPSKNILKKKVEKRLNIMLESSLIQEVESFCARPVIFEAMEKCFSNLIAQKCVFNHQEILLHIKKHDLFDSFKKSIMKSVPVTKAIGFWDIYEGLYGNLKIEDVKRNIISSTMQYAKKQNTWFNNQLSYDYILTK